METKWIKLRDLIGESNKTLAEIIELISAKQIKPYIYATTVYESNYGEGPRYNKIDVSDFIEIDASIVVENHFNNRDEILKEECLILSDGRRVQTTPRPHINNLCFQRSQVDLFLSKAIFQKINRFEVFKFKGKIFEISSAEAEVLERMEFLQKESPGVFLKNNAILENTQYSANNVRKIFQKYPGLVEADGLIIPDSRKGFYSLHPSSLT